ncbi:MAG TPA: hypothetical protein DEQ41_04750, partial [Shewanella sp.]|nr:hypothetical protein [Shewanella sp.]
DTNSLPRQTLIPDSTGAASASMPRYAIVINALRPLRAGVGVILLALGNLKYLKCPQTYTSFPGTGETVTFRARDGEAELTGTYSQRVTGSPVRKAHRR